MAGKTFTTSEAANYLGLSPRTLEKWRVLGNGPKYVRMSSRCVRYRPQELDEFVEARLQESTVVA